jgi:hypothetical protein
MRVGDSETHSRAGAPGAAGPGVGGSLLDEVGVEAVGAPARRPGVVARAAGRVGRALRMSPADMLNGVAGAFSRRPRVWAGALALLLGGGGFGAWWATRFEPPPDYETARLDTLFEYTLLTDDFNKLSVEERLALIGQLIDRLKAMGTNDSLLLAMFASTIMGEMRAQLEENVSRLAIDVADKFAADYDPNVPADEKEQYLEDAFVDMQRLFAVVDTDLATKDRDEMLDDGRRQAKRDLNRFNDGKVGAGEVIRVFDLMNNKVGSRMSGHQKMRVQTMFRDMTEMLRAGP